MTFTIRRRASNRNAGPAPFVDQCQWTRIAAGCDGHWSDAVGPIEDGWEADAAMVRSAYTLRADDDDFAQAGVLVREVFDERQREALIEQVAGSLAAGVHGEVLERAFQYWKHIDADVGQRIEGKVRDRGGLKVAASQATA